MGYLTAKGWLTPEEREFIKQAAERVPADGHILNVGIEYGASLHCIRAGNKQCRVTAMDIIGDEKLVNGDGLGISIVRGDSGLYAQRWQSPLHFAFIDGDHTYSGVEKDVKYGASIVKGGIMAFHDCYSWESPGEVHKICPEVNAAVSDWYVKNQDIWEELPYVSSIRVFRKVLND